MFKKSNELSKDAKMIREQVFMEEQGFQNEFDEIDENACHIVFYDDDIPMAVCRYYKAREEGEYHIGRIAVLKEYRGKQMGNQILRVAEELIRQEGGKKIVLSAQVRVRAFYEKNGFSAVGEAYLDEYCVHINMEKTIN